MTENNQQIIVDENLCIKCGACIKACPCSIFRRDNEGKICVSTKLTSMCIKCGHCMAICPKDAIAIDGLEISGFRSISGNLPTYDALLVLQQSRRSIRNFKKELVDGEVINKIIEAARYAPTAKNTQLLSWIIVNGREKVLKVVSDVAETFDKIPAMKPISDAFKKGADPIARGASQLAIIYGPSEYSFGTIDASIATETFDLAAKTLGVGVCWGGFITLAANQNPILAKNLGLNDQEKIFAVMMFGYPELEYKKIPTRKPAVIKYI